MDEVSNIFEESGRQRLREEMAREEREAIRRAEMAPMHVTVEVEGDGGDWTLETFQAYGYETVRGIKQRLWDIWGHIDHKMPHPGRQEIVNERGEVRCHSYLTSDILMIHI